MLEVLDAGLSLHERKRIGPAGTAPKGIFHP